VPKHEVLSSNPRNAKKKKESSIYFFFYC
jgi:hypothetical protein